MILYAYARASGLIEYGRYVPNGALELVHGRDDFVRDRIAAHACRAPDGENWLVPGISDAATGRDKMHALRRFADRVTQ